MAARVKQVLVAVLGAAIVVALLALGLWQMRVFENKQSDSAAERAAQPATPLLGYLDGSSSLDEAYGRQVSITGRYLPDQQLTVIGEDGTIRVLTAFELADGRVVAVVRGVSSSSAVPRPPTSQLTQTGVLLPTEDAGDRAVPAGSYASVRLPAIAQVWPQQLVDGFVTLGATEASEQGLRPASASLPTGDGSLTNLGYAMQWWAFAAFAALMTWHFVRVIGRRGRIGTLSEQEET